ncbi:MAG: MoxR family ATPase, partial [Spirochaetes bacterium]|nr:MoxR family ATPase [Spirochaetota bacterium]
KALVLLGYQDLDPKIATETLNFILKYEKDIEMAIKESKTIFQN